MNFRSPAFAAVSGLPSPLHSPRSASPFAWIALVPLSSPSGTDRKKFWLGGSGLFYFTGTVHCVTNSVHFTAISRSFQRIAHYSAPLCLSQKPSRSSAGRHLSNIFVRCSLWSAAIHSPRSGPTNRRIRHFVPAHSRQRLSRNSF
jgi:hypothetical protein